MLENLNRNQVMTIYWGVVFGGSLSTLIAGALSFYIRLELIMTIISASVFFCLFLAISYIRGIGRITFKISDAIKIKASKGFLLFILIILVLLLLSWPFDEIIGVLVQALGFREAMIAGFLMMLLSNVFYCISINRKLRMDEAIYVILLVYIPFLFILTNLLQFSLLRILSLVMGTLVSFYGIILLHDYHYYQRRHKLEMSIVSDDTKLEFKFFNISNNRAVRLVVVGSFLWMFTILLFIIRLTILYN
jgi:hypothetical protein